MLTALAACGAVTAFVAGIAGAWSPCGLSMIDTIGSALGDTRRAPRLIAVSTFCLGAVLGGVITFGALALLGSLFGDRSGAVRAGIGGAVALAAAVADWRGLRIAPQIRRQVPERWRWIMPLPLACALYGVLLGLGFTTFVLAFAVWALAALSVAAGSIAVGISVGVAFGIGRAIPIVWLAPGVGSERGARRLEQIALEPRLLLGTRRLGAIGLALCAAAFAATPAFGHETRPSLTTVATAATDPTSNGSDLAWQTVGGGGMIEIQGTAARALPGELPALGGSNVAWVSGATIVVADAASLAPEVTLPIPPATTVSTLAVSDSWLVANLLPSAGGDQLVAYSLADPTAAPKTIATAAFAGAIGRPALTTSDVVFALGGSRGSAIDEIDLNTATKTVLRSVKANYSLENPVLTGDNDLLYEQIGRCAQSVYIGSTSGKRPTARLLSLPSTVIRDPGYQPGYVRDYDQASHCPNRGTGPGAKRTLGTTAVGTSTLYVTEYPRAPARSTIVALALKS